MEEPEIAQEKLNNHTDTTMLYLAVSIAVDTKFDTIQPTIMGTTYINGIEADIYCLNSGNLIELVFLKSNKNYLFYNFT